MKQIYLFDDIVDLKKALKQVKKWHPKAKIKTVTDVDKAIKDPKAKVVVVRGGGV